VFDAALLVTVVFTVLLMIWPIAVATVVSMGAYHLH
jgi:hypothetical protein